MTRKIFSGYKSKLREWLRESPHFHIREANVNDLSDVVKLVDRFLDDELEYPLEWDDFISWEQQNPKIEKVRQIIAETEPLFFNNEIAAQEKGKALVLNARNQAAAECGLDHREA